jgi:kinase-associated protein B
MEHTSPSRSWEKGMAVKTYYKTGEYIGHIFDRTSSKIVVQIAAVLRHPEQGDLHHPYRADVPYFHPRKALAHRERALVTAEQLDVWYGEVPEYTTSLQVALLQEMRRMEAHPQRAWAERGLEQLHHLQKEYGLLDIGP